MSYYDTMKEDLARAKQILQKGKAEPLNLPVPDHINFGAGRGGTIYGGDTYAAYMLLKSLTEEVEKFHGLFSDYDDPCDSFEQAERIWNHLKEREARG